MREDDVKLLKELKELKELQSKNLAIEEQREQDKLLQQKANRQLALAWLVYFPLFIVACCVMFLIIFG